MNIGNVGTRENPLEKTGVLENSETWSGVIRVTGDARGVIANNTPRSNHWV